MRDFLEESVRYLRDVYLPRIDRAVAALAEKDLWWRPHAQTNSVGNLLLHLAGNIRQWIVCGVGGAPDERRRAEEFAARDGATRADLLRRLSDTILEACGVLEALDANKLRDPYRMQGIDGTVMSAIYHVVEHLSWHTGQIVWIAKFRAGETHGIAFYDDSKL